VATVRAIREKFYSLKCVLKLLIINSNDRFMLFISFTKSTYNWISQILVFRNLFMPLQHECFNLLQKHLFSLSYSLKQIKMK
jgi:hypothetical protein